MFRDTSVTTWIFLISKYFKWKNCWPGCHLVIFTPLYEMLPLSNMIAVSQMKLARKKSVRPALSNNKKKLTRRRNFYGFCQDYSKYDNLFYRSIINFSETLPKEGKVTWVIQRVLVPQTSELTLFSTLFVSCNKVCLHIK